MPGILTKNAWSGVLPLSLEPSAGMSSLSTDSLVMTFALGTNLVTNRRREYLNLSVKYSWMDSWISEGSVSIMMDCELKS